MVSLRHFFTIVWRKILHSKVHQRICVVIEAAMNGRSGQLELADRDPDAPTENPTAFTFEDAPADLEDDT